MNEIDDFFQAVGAGDLEGLRRGLATHPELAHARDVDGATPLHHAAFHGHRLLVAALVDAGADVNARDFRHDATPSGWAIHYLRELGGLLAIEIDDVRHAIETGDVAWARRLVTRHPALLNAQDASGTWLSTLARESGNESLAGLFRPAESRRRPT